MQPQHWINALAVAFLVVRLCFVFAYLKNFPTTRTLLWNLWSLGEYCNLLYAVVVTSYQIIEADCVLRPSAAHDPLCLSRVLGNPCLELIHRAS